MAARPAMLAESAILFGCSCHPERGTVGFHPTESTPEGTAGLIFLQSCIHFSDIKIII